MTWKNIGTIKYRGFELVELAVALTVEGDLNKNWSASTHCAAISYNAVALDDAFGFESTYSPQGRRLRHVDFVS
jgi:hypothetical protein